MNAKYREYREYVERVMQMAETGVAKNPRIKSWEEWHFDDYKDRVEHYLMAEYDRDFLSSECWTDDRTEDEAEELYDQICTVIEQCYDQKLSVVIPAVKLQEIFCT